MDEEIGLRLNLKNRRETVAGLDDVGDKLDRAGDEAEQVGRKSRLAAGGVVALGRSGKIAGRAMVYGFGAASAAVVGAGIVLTKLSKDSIAEAREAQKVGAVTRQEIKSTGAAANISAKGVERLAGAISKKVGIDDEEIQSAANLLLMNKNVANQMGKGNKIFDRATLGAVNLSAVTGTLTTNSRLLGKVLNDPLKAITGLTKAGVKFNDEQIKQIENMVKNNDLLGAQKLVLDQVEKRVGGVAAAQATWGEKASVSIGNIKEDIGTALLPALDATEKWFVQKGAPVLEDYVGIFEKRGIPAIQKYAGVFRDKGIPAIRDFLEDAKPLAMAVLPAIGDGLKTTRDLFGDIAPVAKAVFDGFNKLPDWAKSAVALTVGGAAVGKKLGAFDRGGVLGSIASAARPLPVLVTNPGFGAGGGVGSPGGGVVAGGAKPPKGVGGKFSRLPKGSVPATILITAALASDDVQTILSDPIGELKAELLYPWVDGPFAPGHEISKAWKSTMAGIEANTVDGTQAMAKLLGIPLKALNHDFDVLGAKKPRPSVAAPGLDNTLLGGDRLIGLLKQIDGYDARPRISIDGVDSALSAIGNVGNALSGLIGSFGGSSSGGSTGPHDWSGLGGSKKAPGTGSGHGRSPRLFIPKSGGTTAPHVPTGSAGRASTVPPLHIHVNVDGREMALAVVDDLQTKDARK